ncbi:hypothetical protein H4Q26_018137 [Puccinia striiformis f. sp. tritici PST-130]|nr:hypothetical protein H4Q26_018137 [Puccinia striiformis f. sp. tritici PST-130]
MAHTTVSSPSPPLQPHRLPKTHPHLLPPRLLASRPLDCDRRRLFLVLPPSHRLNLTALDRVVTRDHSLRGWLLSSQAPLESLLRNHQVSIRVTANLANYLSSSCLDLTKSSGEMAHTTVSSPSPPNQPHRLPKTPHPPLLPRLLPSKPVEAVVGRDFSFIASSQRSPELPVYSIIRTGFPAGPRVRFRPEPPPRPTLTLLDYSPEVDHPLSIDHPLENEYYPSSRLTIGDRSLGYISPPPTSSSELLPSIVILTYSISTFPITLLDDRSSGQTSSPHDPRRKSESNQPLSYPSQTIASRQPSSATLQAELDHRIFFNQSLRDYRSDKRMQTITRRDLLFKFMVHVTNELIKDPRPTVHSKDFDAVTFKKRFEALEKALNNDRLNSPQEKKNAAVFNARFEEYKAALIQAQEVEVQATQKGDKTIIPTSKILKLETPQTPITEKPVDKKNKATKKKILPLDSSIGDLSISSFTTEPFFEDLEPTLKRITPKRALPAISDSESEAGISIDHPSSPILERIASKPELSILSDSEDELDEERRAKQARRTDQGPQNPEGNDQTPRILGDYPRTPFVGRKSSLQRDGIRERGRDSGSGNHPDPHQKAGEDPRQIPKGDLERRQEVNLGSGSTEPARPPETHPEQGNQELRERVESLGRKEESVPGPTQEQEETEIRQTEPTSSKRKQPPRPNPLELQPRPNSLDQQPQPNPFKHEQRPRSVEQQLQTNSLEPKQQTLPRGERRSRRPSEVEGSTSSYCSTRSFLSPHQKVNSQSPFQSKIMSSLSTINHNITTLESNLDVNTTKILRTVEKCYIKSAKTSSEISDQLSDPLPVQMGPLEKSLVSHLKKEIDKVSNLVKNINGTSNPESIESLTTQIKYLRDTVYNLQNKQKELINSLPKQSNESISDVFASLRIEIKSLTDIASVLSQKPTPDNSADIMEKLEQSEASILSNVKQDLITEVRVYVQKEVETLTNTVTTSFGGIMSQLRNMEQNSNDKFNNLQRDIVEIKKEIISVDNRVAKAESNRLTSPLTYSSPTPFKTVVETENKNSPSKDLPPHQTQSIKEDDDRGPRLTEKEVGKLLPPLTEWVSFSGEGEYDYIEFIQYCDLILETYWAKEDIVVVRLPRLFRGVAKVWWKTKSAAMGKASWQTWKDLMKAQFNTSTWRSKMKEAFRKEKSYCPN